MSTERQIGFSYGPIPHSAIVAMADRMGWDEDLTIECMRRMDDEYLAYANADQKDRKKVSKQPLTPELFKALFRGKK